MKIILLVFIILFFETTNFGAPLFQDNQCIYALHLAKMDTPQIIKGKPKSKKYINYQDCPDDSVFKFFIKENNINLKNAVFVSIDRISIIKDSVEKLKMNIINIEKSASIEIYKKADKKKQSISQYRYFIWSYYNSNVTSGDYDEYRPMNVYTLNRSIPDSAGDRTNVDFKEIKTPFLFSPFPIDSIGNTPPAIDYEKVDYFSKTVRSMPIKQLAMALTNPWKKEAEKVRAIYKWMDYNLKYDYQGLQTGHPTTDPEDVLAKKVAVCQGYAELFSALCNAAGIRNEFISGVAKKSKTDFSGHAWNAVCIDKKWYLIDVTWGERFYLKSPEYFYNEHFPKTNRWTLFPEYRSFDHFKNMEERGVYF